MNTTTNTTPKDDDNTRRTTCARTVVAAVVMAAGALVPTAGEAGPVEDVETICLAGASGTADSLERWAEHCRVISSEYREVYHDCMRNAPGTADSLERWVDRCAAGPPPAKMI